LTNKDEFPKKHLFFGNSFIRLAHKAEAAINSNRKAMLTLRLAKMSSKKRHAKARAKNKQDKNEAQQVAP